MIHNLVKNEMKKDDFYKWIEVYDTTNLFLTHLETDWKPIKYQNYS